MVSNNKNNKNNDNDNNENIICTNLVEKTFGNEFNENNYIEFITELFSSEYIKSPKKYNVWEEYRDYVEYIKYYGTYIDKSNNKNKIDILEIKLRKSSFRDRARTMQRNLVAKWLEKYNKDGAIVSFYGDDLEDWRLSFIKMEYTFTEDFNVEIKYTPAKRFSFLVGKNEPNHTCKKRFLNLLVNDSITLEDIEEAFNVEVVSDEFFKEYKELYLTLKEELDNILENNNNNNNKNNKNNNNNNNEIKKEFEEKGISTVDFAKKLLGQIVFLYFLQKKGWLGVKKGDDGKIGKWGDGPKDFLRKLYGKEYKEYNNFFKDVLEPLFYEALSTQRDDDYYTLFNCKIPFLNGGLFEPIGGYNWRETNLNINNKIFEKIFSVFDKYNFTIKEDEPLDKEVAIDPEMLGRVFENLLDVVNRKSKGAFYTPREIVYYMCQQSLINYLEQNINEINREDVEKFINISSYLEGDYQKKLIELEKIKKKHSNTKSISEKQKLIEKETKLLNELKETFPKSILKNTDKIDKLLSSVKIADPAVGSGAFPVGMLNEIVKAKSILTPFLVMANKTTYEERKTYNLKWEIIQNCLYGVDIDSSAVDITKLRFWLSLVVDEEDINNIRALPNLDHKIMCGNSLLDEFEKTKLFNEDILKNIDVVEKPEELIKLEKEKEEKEKLAKEYMENLKWRDLEIISNELSEINKEIKKLENKYIREKNKEKNEIDVQCTLTEGDGIERKILQNKIKELEKLHKKYFNEKNKKDKKELEEKIQKLEWEIIEKTVEKSGDNELLEKLQQYKKSRTKPFFLWKLYFSEVFVRENPGFDIVIGNPPYVRQEKIKELKEVLERNYTCYTGMADLYVYFYELGYNILNNKGNLSFITSNKWMRANYGEKLRKLIKDKTEIIEIIDFGGEKVFETATVDTNILTFKKGFKENNIFNCVDFGKIKEYSGFINGIKENKFKINQNDLEYNTFNLIPMEELNLKKKIEKIGIPLKDWDIKIYRGVLTGFNEAFIIDGKTKDELINKDIKNKEIIKPILRGRDIKRYSYEFADLWLINTHNGIKNKNIPPVDVPKDYPVIYEWLKQFEEKLKKRSDKGDNWWNLRNCAYLEEFEKEKIVYSEIVREPQFHYDTEKYYTNQACYVMACGNKYILAVLNSKISYYYMKNISYSLGTGAFRWIKQYVERIPIPKIPENQQIPFIEKADKMIKLNKKFINKKNEFLKSLDLDKITKKLETFYNLSYGELLKELKKQKINTDLLNNLENQFNSYKNELNEIKREIEKTDKEIDKMVYKLYNLTDDEIKLIEKI